jgi:DNA-binding FadR family transcriptional regulator
MISIYSQLMVDPHQITGAPSEAGLRAGAGADATETIRALANDLGHGRTSAEIVADALRQLIAIGAFRGGDRLPRERELAASLGASRSTVRSALHKLAADGVVEIRKGRHGGAIVLGEVDAAPGETALVSSDAFAQAVDQSFEFRLLIEPEAAALAAERASQRECSALLTLVQQPATTLAMWHALDSSFHLMVAQATQNPHIVVAVERQRASFFVWANSVFLLDRELVVRPTFSEEHARIAEAIAARRADRARREMASHLTRSASQFREALARKANRPSEPREEAVS